uniref:Uncharacterized protein LOC114345299 n=1 Tax=Diabrotica virgifera virgifera TaxID=50390 RepID=A0A6P7GPU2_DIAVI
MAETESTAEPEPSPEPEPEPTIEPEIKTVKVPVSEWEHQTEPEPSAEPEATPKPAPEAAQMDKITKLEHESKTEATSNKEINDEHTLKIERIPEVEQETQQDIEHMRSFYNESPTHSDVHVVEMQTSLPTTTKNYSSDFVIPLSDNDDNQVSDEPQVTTKKSPDSVDNGILVGSPTEKAAEEHRSLSKASSDSENFFLNPILADSITTTTSTESSDEETQPRKNKNIYEHDTFNKTNKSGSLKIENDLSKLQPTFCEADAAQEEEIR